MSNRIVRKFELRNDLAELPRLAEEVELFAADAAIGAADMSRLQLAVDEAVTNSIMYGLPTGEAHRIYLNFAYNDREVEINIEDEGVDFDPLSFEHPEIKDVNLEDREVGGLGVFLIREIMDAVEYARVGSRNRLTMRKRVEG